MNSIIVSCPTLRKELLAALDKAGSQVPVYFVPASLHSSPRGMHAYLQRFIDSMANVERIYLCVSGCGGSTVGLKASTAELVLPRTRDCLDILLSTDNLNNLPRDIHGVYYTASWMDFMQHSAIDLKTLTAKKGRQEAEAYLRKLYQSCHNYYVIDTGCYDLQPVLDYVAPFLQVVQGNLQIVQGQCKILEKIATEKIDDDFYCVQRGKEVPQGIFLSNW